MRGSQQQQQQQQQQVRVASQRQARTQTAHIAVVNSLFIKHRVST
jgi:hypothetical protein